MKENWTYKKLGEVCDVSAGQGAPQGEENYCAEGTPFIKAGNIEELINGLDENYIQKVNESVAKSHKLKLYKAGSVVFAKSGMSCMKGLVYTLKQDCHVVSHLAVLTPKKVNSSFLNYALKYFKPNKLVKDEAYPSISLSDISNFFIPVPSIETQSRIVSELDLLQSIIDKQQAQLKELDKLAQSIFYDLFGDPVENEKGWSLMTMEDVCLNIVDCPHSTPKKSNRITNYPCIRTSELKEGSIYWNSMQYLEEDEYIIRIARLKPIAGDIVFGREGTIGDAVILPDGYNFSLGQRTMLLRVDSSLISNIFLQKVILSECIKKQIRMVNVSSTVPHVNIKDFKQFEIPVPPLALQQSFAAKIESVEKTKAAINQSIKETKMFFDYTMDKYFG